MPLQPFELPGNNAIKEGNPFRMPAEYRKTAIVFPEQRNFCSSPARAKQA
jgi:hypothetical protein